MPIISVIIPVFNVEQYLEQALESLKYQTFKDIEVICVDDGSTDGSGNVCEKFSKSDKRFKVIYQKNLGAGAARNAGLDIARGKYVSFMNGDDWLHPNFLEVLYRLCEDNQCDIAQCGFSMIWTDKDIALANHCEAVIVVGTDMVWKTFLPDDGWRNLVVWNKLYRKEILADLRFPYGKRHEDEFFPYKILYKARHVAVTGCPLYYYRQRSDSSTGIGFTVDKMKNQIEAVEEKVVFFADNKNDEICFRANLELRWHLQNYLQELNQYMPERSDLKSMLQEKLQAVCSTIELLDCEAVRNVDWREIRYCKKLALSNCSFELESQYNRDIVFKSGIQDKKETNIQLKVSVIIPIYNVERFLAKCLESVIKQTLTEIEIICVEDGSTDNSRMILETYAVKDSRIKIISHETNRGTLVSRKDAVAAAQGKYIMFVDPDDTLFPYACEIAYEVILKNQTDMVQFNVQIIDSSGSVTQQDHLKIANDTDRKEAPNILHLKMQEFLTSWELWNKIFRSDLCKKAYNEIESEYSVLAEDFCFFCVFGYYARSVSMIRDELYQWKWGDGIWTGIRPEISLERYKKMLTEKVSLDAVTRFINSKSDAEEYQVWLQKIHNQFLLQTILWWSDNLEEKSKEEGFQLLIEKWGYENTVNALKWLLDRNSSIAVERLAKLQKEKEDLLRSRAELEIIKKSNGYKALTIYYKVKSMILNKL